MNTWTSFPEEYYSLLERGQGTILLQTARFDDENYRSFLFLDPLRILCAYSGEEVEAVFEQIEKALQQGCFVAGYLSYECRKCFANTEPREIRDTAPLAWFGVYRRPFIFDHRTGTFGDARLAGHVESLTPGAQEFEIRGVQIGVTEEQYAKRIAAIHEYIRSGDTYQVNLTDKITFEFSGRPIAMFRELGRQQRVAYGAFLDTGNSHILSFSPELFFRRTGNKIVTRPMKGTARRGRNAAEDARSAGWLASDAKNCSENIMIVDLLRNDLGRICDFGSVGVEELFRVERYETLLQMTSTVSGRLRKGLRQFDIFSNIFPCGSVTGAPKIRTMEIIDELEQHPRGVYTGAIGYIDPVGDAVFNVAIRTAELKGNRGEMGIGSGIVIDSSAADEYKECLLKAEFLTQRVPSFQLIETLLWDGEYKFLPLHRDRIRESAGYFGFAFDGEAFQSTIKSFASRLQRGSRYKVRVLLDRSGNLTMESTVLKDEPVRGRVTIARERTLSTDRFLFHKTTNRRLYDPWYTWASSLGYDDVLFLNEHGEITEGAISNIFIVKGELWYTPPLECGVLPGVFRRHVLETNSLATEAVLRIEDLLSADAVYICNAVRGMRQVSLEAAEEAGRAGSC